MSPSQRHANTMLGMPKVWAPKSARLLPAHLLRGVGDPKDLGTGLLSQGSHPGHVLVCGQQCPDVCILQHILELPVAQHNPVLVIHCKHKVYVIKLAPLLLIKIIWVNFSWCV